MIDQSALEQGSVTYQEIVAEGKRLVDALKELAVEPKQQNLAIVPEGRQIIEALKELAVAVSICHREQFPGFPSDICPKIAIHRFGFQLKASFRTARRSHFQIEVLHSLL